MEESLAVQTISRIDIFRGRSNVDLVQLKDDIDQWIENSSNVDNLDINYDPVTETYTGKDATNDLIFRPDSSLIDDVVEDIRKSFEKFTGIDLIVEKEWVHVHEKNMSTDKHNHYPLDVSAVFYVSVPDGSGDIVFHPSHNKYQPQRTSFPPEEGVFYIFPGILDHSVTRNNSNERRISLSCNFKIVHKETPNE
tara:strand:- start:52 stop:633 length:582 start_codon:yes stop_codon:yes gene_type:complete